jgi:hypothetical protein
MAESREALQPQLNVYGEYCKQWKLEVIAEKNKIPDNQYFYYIPKFPTHKEV